MKTAIIFYSYSGNTKKACLFLEEKLKEKNISSELFDLKPEHEEKGFLLQCRAAFRKDAPQLKNQPFDQNKYDFIIFASPVWALTFAPALRTYLQMIDNLGDKKIGCFLTYGSGLGKGKALSELENVLKEKRGRILFSKNLPGIKVKDNTYLSKQLNPLLDIISHA